MTRVARLAALAGVLLLVLAALPAPSVVAAHLRARPPGVSGGPREAGVRPGGLAVRSA